MVDSVQEEKNLDIVWGRLLSAARASWEERDKDPYFMGVYEGMMSTLAEISICIGRYPEYAHLREELDGIVWVELC